MKKRELYEFKGFDEQGNEEDGDGDGVLGTGIIFQEKIQGKGKIDDKKVGQKRKRKNLRRRTKTDRCKELNQLKEEEEEKER